MQSYRSWAEVDVWHSYFADGHARHMRFSPHPQTAMFLHRFGMPMHADGSSLAIGVDEAQLPGIWSERQGDGEDRMLRFDVRSADPEGAAYYTEPATASMQSACAGASPVPLEEVASTAAAPLATIALPLNPAGGDDYAAWVAALGARYCLRLCHRRTIWKYLLVGDWRDRKLAIVDQRGEVTFTAPTPERMPDGRSVLVARSTSPVALQEQPPQRFQLHDLTDATKRILIPRLPGAQPQRLWREMLDGEPTSVSEIFIHS